MAQANNSQQDIPLASLRTKLVFQARLARRSARRFIQASRYGYQVLSNAPVLFANSFPKSGTHLLTQVLQGFTRIGPAVDSSLPAIVTFDGFTGRQRSQSEILDDLGRLLPGDIAYGHLHATPVLVETLCHDGMAAYFILRDPRDVAVSHVHYVAEMAPKHIHHHYYQEVLRTFEERLSASICGVSERELEAASGKPAYEPLPDIRGRFEPYLDWLAHPEVQPLRYEDFVTQREKTVERVFDHAVQRGFAARCSKEQAIEALLAGIDPQRSPTFRSGLTGGWRKVFSEAHKAAFKEVSGDLLIRLGYEDHDSW